MGVLLSALEMARRGYRVFPLTANSGIPSISAFQHEATTDETIIRAWFEDPVLRVERDANYGVLCNDNVVVDIDIKNGKPGLASYQSVGGHFDTFTVRTPSGGFHCYFAGPNSAPAVDLLPGLDIRSNNSYVVGPGSVINGRMYQVVNDTDVPWVPLEIEKRLKQPGARDERHDAGVDLDSPSSIALATEWLMYNAPLAVEGMGGDNTTYQVCARVVRDYALTVETAFELLSRYWNDRCSPPWLLDDLYLKVGNAAAYGTKDLGAALPQQTFATVALPPPPPTLEERGLRFGNAVDPTMIPARRWLMEGLLSYGHVTVLGAAGSAGKSALSLAVAAHLVHGMSFGPWRPRAPCKAVLYNAEDDLEEQSRRLLAICMHFGLDYTATKARLLLIDRELFPVSLATRNQGGNVLHAEAMNALIEMCRGPDIGLLALDPLVELSELDENDNGQMKYLMNILRHIAKEADVALLAPHHGAKGKTKLHGDADLFRGASAITSAARINLTMVPMTPEDAAASAIRDEDRGDYVRVDGAKINLVKRSATPQWLRWQTVKLLNGDLVGVVEPSDLSGAETRAAAIMAAALHGTIVAKGSGSIDMKTAILSLKKQDTLYANMTDHAIRSQIERIFSAGVRHEDAVLSYVRENNEAKIVLH
jgi:hypothetical protein